MAARVRRCVQRRKATVAKRQARRVKRQALQAELRAGVVRLLQQSIEQALQGEVTALLGRDKYRPRGEAPLERSGVACSGCGRDLRRRFYRAGSYQRTLLTLQAEVRIRMPRVGCLCGSGVPLEFETLAPYQRSWDDLQERARELAGLCLSLGKMRELLARDTGQVLAASTLNRWVQQAAALAAALRAGPLERVPAVVMLDGIWTKLLVPTEESYVDRRGRRRRRRKRVRVVLLVALGVDPQSGEHWVLDWERADGEDEGSWRRLLERLLERGLRTDRGLELLLSDGAGGLEAALGQVYLGPGLLHQRCVFHLLRNIRAAVRGEAGLSREAQQARRAALLGDAAQIFQATERESVQQRRRAFGATWSAQEPQAVATLERAFVATTRYLEALERGRERGEVWQPRFLRTTSLLERANRALRAKLRQAGAFHSEAGLLAAVVLVLVHGGLDTWEPQDDWTEALEQRLLTA
jgi:transposase-like protein